MSLPSQNVTRASAEPKDLLKVNWPDEHPGDARRTQGENYRLRHHCLPFFPLFLHLFSSQIFMEPLFCARHWARTWGYRWAKKIKWSLFWLYLDLYSHVPSPKKLPWLNPYPTGQPACLLYPIPLPVSFLHSLPCYFCFFSSPIPAIL